ncbi:GDSL-type esterase/lipase family protein [Candidatus Latescibacterota bacterium]
MKFQLIFYVWLCLLVPDVTAQQTTTGAETFPPPVELSRGEDHKRMMDILGITELRRGANGMDMDAPNYANYDESKATPYPDLPEILVTNDGQKVTTPEMWWNVRRPEIVELFDREIYGRVPENTPAVTWEVVETKQDTVGTRIMNTKQLLGHVDNSSYPHITVDIQLSLSIPADATGPVPVMLEFGFVFPRGSRFANRPRPANAPPSWKEQVASRDWGYAVIVPNSIQADNGEGLTQGIIGLCNKGRPRDADDWGVLHAWAWGASRAMDYFETDRGVDAGQVGIEGVSRYGKAAIVAMAYDQRFVAGLIASSGKGGSALYRRNWGERLENIADPNAYHWVAGNYMKYSADPLTADDLPVDTHMLVALCAPRITFLSGSTPEAGDGWVDTKGTFMAGAAAGPVFSLLGKKDMGTDEFPTTGTPLVNGAVAFRQHTDGHTAGSNWGYFLDLCGKNGMQSYTFGRGRGDEPLPQAGNKIFWDKHTELIEKTQKGNIDLYIVGDSITRRWEATHQESWDKNFSGWNAADFGSGGDRTRNVIYRAIHGELDNVNPKVIAILIGTNNVGFYPPKGNYEPLVEDTVKGIKAYVKLLKEMAPGAKIILTAITPRNTKGTTDVMPIIDAINERIASIGDGKTVHFINVNEQMAGADGKLFEGVTDDGIHLSNMGYQIWADAMKPLLTEWLGPRGTD